MRTIIYIIITFGRPYRGHRYNDYYNLKFVRRADTTITNYALRIKRGG